MGKGDPEGGRPRVEIDMSVLEGMVQIQCTKPEIAEVLGVSEKTIDRRLEEETGEGFDVYYKRHSGMGKRSLRRAQFTTALGSPAREGFAAVPGNPTMQIWLGKQMLGQKDKQELALTDPEGGKFSFNVIIPGLIRE